MAILRDLGSIIININYYWKLLPDFQLNYIVCIKMLFAFQIKSSKTVSDKLQISVTNNQWCEN